MLPKNFYEKLAEKDLLFKQGAIKGAIKGRKKRDKEIARKMKLHGFDKELISEITELPVKTIEKI